MVQVDRVCKRKKVPIVALVAMTLCWSLIFGGPSYPLHLCGLEVDPNAPAMLLVYAGELAISCALVAAFWQRLLHAPRRLVLACAAAAEALAAWTLYTADTQVPAFAFMLIAAMGVLALASVVLFALWFATLCDIDAAGVAGWTAVSFVLFSAAELVGSWVRVLPASPTVLAPLGLLACAALLRLPGEAIGTTPCPARPGRAMASLMLVGCLCLVVGMVADALYGSGVPVALLGFEEFRMRRTVLRCVEVAVFAPVAVALVHGLRLLPVLAGTGAVIVVLLVAELQSAPILLQMGWASADLPGVVITATCQAFLWLVAVCWFGGDQTRALVPVYVAAAVALPKALLMVGSTATSGLVPGSSLSFVLAAVTTWAVVALTCCLFAVFILHLRCCGRLAVQSVPVTEMSCLAVETVGECPVPERAPAASGPLSVSPAADERYGLSRREREVFELLGRGYTVKRIAETLYVSESTAQTHVRRIYAKVGVHSKQELIEELERRGEA